VAHRRHPLIIAVCTGVIGVAVLFPTNVEAADPASVAVIQTQTVGNTAFAWSEVSSTTANGLQAVNNVPTRQLPSCGSWSTWTLLRVNPNTGSRRFGELIYNGCSDNTQQFPTPVDPTQGSCTNSDASRRSIQYSLCPTLPKGTVPAGHLDSCLALAEASVALHAGVTPSLYDSSQPTALIATTSFDSDFTQRLSDATCSDVLSWSVSAWEITWQDGVTDTLRGTGTAGTSDAHVTTAAAAGASQVAAVVARAHIHIVARAVDFDDNADPVVVRLERDVVISNDATANGAASQGSILPVYTQPQLATGAVASLQSADGTLRPPDPAQPATQHADTLRGRLLQLLPRAVVLRPGTESVAGVVIGQGTTTTISWEYLGPVTDAPAREGTRPGDTGSAGDVVGVQWNHAARVDGGGRTLDELVRLNISARTTYPDGHTESTSMTGAISISIFYVGLDLGSG
jgi:hypothetical protein